MSKSTNKRFYSILNHNRVTVACCSNLKVAVEWVNSHPSRSLSEVLQYHSTYHVMRKRGKVLFELGGLECSIIESSLLFAVDQAHSSQHAGSLAQKTDLSSVNVSDVVGVADVHDKSYDYVTEFEFESFTGHYSGRAAIYHHRNFRAVQPLGQTNWLLYEGTKLIGTVNSESQAESWVEGQGSNTSQHAGPLAQKTDLSSVNVSEIVDEKGTQLLELGKLGCTWKIPNGGTQVYVYFGGGCIYAGTDWSIAVRVAQRKVAHSLISAGRVA